MHRIYKYFLIINLILFILFSLINYSALQFKNVFLLLFVVVLISFIPFYLFQKTKVPGSLIVAILIVITGSYSLCKYYEIYNIVLTTIHFSNFVFSVDLILLYIKYWLFK